MIADILYEDEKVKWFVFGREPAKPDYVIDTNEYLVISEGRGLLMDPGGTEIFPDVVAAIADHIAVENIDYIFGSHQDPDILSSLALWLGVCPNAKVYVPRLWIGFITHFGCDASQIVGIPDDGMSLTLGSRHRLDFIPAHYLHSSGNHHLYDPTAQVLFSGDVGAALMPDNDTSLYVEDFQKHIGYMQGFHQRWMPSNRARDVWLERVRPLGIKQMCPQHGAIFKDAQVKQFMDWFARLELGLAAA